MIIDSHAHLFFKDFSHDLDEVIARAVDAGVDAMICPGTDLETSRRSIALAERFPMVFACTGFHPHDAVNADDRYLAEIEELSRHPKVVAIGEIGLDYHYDFSPRDRQRRVFEQQIEIAVRRDLPIVIHCREAEADCLRIVEDAARQHPQWRGSHTGAARGVFHCFSGDVAMARTVIGWNFLISVTGPVTFPVKPGKPNTMADVVAAIPLEHILVETDCPYLSPVPYRGKRNEPAYVLLIAKTLAAIKQLSLEEVGRITNGGVHRLFGVGP